MSAVVVLLSGGYDSAALVAYARQHGHDVTALFVDLGQPTLKNEQRAVRRVTSLLDVKLVQRSMDCAKPHDDGYVPGRNFLLVAAAAAYADSIGADTVMYGAIRATLRKQRTGPALFPDTSGDFMRAANRLSHISTKTKVSVTAPLIDWTKGNIRAWLRRYDLDEAISRATWSCWAPGTKPCGACTPCIERRDHRVDVIG